MAGRRREVAPILSSVEAALDGLLRVMLYTKPAGEDWVRLDDMRHGDHRPGFSGRHAGCLHHLPRLSAELVPKKPSPPADRYTLPG